MGSISMTEGKPKPHAVCIPYPAQGHITPMLKVAKLLHSRGFHITFVNTEFKHKRLLKSKGPTSLDGHPSFRFESIPDGVPPSNSDATQDVPSLCVSTKNTCLPHFKNLIHTLNIVAASSSNDVSLVSCVVSDGAMSFTLDAAEELGIPKVIFWTTNLCGFMAYCHYGLLIEKGYTPLKGIHHIRSEPVYKIFLTALLLRILIFSTLAISEAPLTDVITFFTYCAFHSSSCQRERQLQSFSGN